MSGLGLACSVRDCGLPLERHARALVCPRGHSYRCRPAPGTWNLLQPQDRRSRAAGDSRSAVEARAALFLAGIGHAMVDGVVRRTSTLDLKTNAVVVDLGSGSGDALGTLAAGRAIEGVGVDLSAAAAEHAARRFPALTWVVANADRRLPFLNESVDLVLSLHARRNPVECARVLVPSGFLLMAIPAEDDLIELRELVQGQGIERSRTEGLLTEHAPFFTVVDRSVVREQRRLDRESLLALLRVTYRGARSSATERIDALGATEVTLASEIVLFSKQRQS